MSGAMQKGIYYGKEPKIGNSVGATFLRAQSGSEAEKVSNVLEDLWKIFTDLEKGIVKGMDFNPPNNIPGNLSVLVGYGPEIFSLSGTKKTMPEELASTGLFKTPNPRGGGYVAGYFQDKILRQNW